MLWSASLVRGMMGGELCRLDEWGGPSVGVTAAVRSGGILGTAGPGGTMGAAGPGGTGGLAVVGRVELLCVDVVWGCPGEVGSWAE